MCKQRIIGINHTLTTGGMAPEFKFLQHIFTQEPLDLDLLNLEGRHERRRDVINYKFTGSWV